MTYSLSEIIVLEVVAALLFAFPYEAVAVVVLAAHLAFILWVILGALLTCGRPVLTGFHISSLVYGIVIELAPWPCPLTLAEQWLQRRAGTTPYTESFLVHYLGALVYPDVPQSLVVWGAVAAAAFNLAQYAKRLYRYRDTGQQKP
jgi:hypothetical protein